MRFPSLSMTMAGCSPRTVGFRRADTLMVLFFSSFYSLFLVPMLVYPIILDRSLSVVLPSVCSWVIIFLSISSILASQVYFITDTY